MTIHAKRADAPLVYTIDWGRGWLGEAAVVAARWSVEPADAAGLVLDARDDGDGRTSVRVSGGEPGRGYRLSGHVLLSDRRSATRSLAFTVSGR